MNNPHRGTRIWLVRHGQTILNKQRRYQGRSDPPLTDYGVRQATALAYRLRRIPFGVVLVSPLERTHATATEILAMRSSVMQPQIIESANWHEGNHGQWEGLTYQEVQQRFPDEVRARFAAGAHGKPTGGESLADVAYRINEAWNDLLGSYAGARVLVVTSATPIQLVLCNAFGLHPDNYWHWRIDLGSITCIDVYQAGAILRMVNEVPRWGKEK